MALRHLTVIFKSNGIARVYAPADFLTFKNRLYLCFLCPYVCSFSYLVYDSVINTINTPPPDFPVCSASFYLTV